ncbi:hypothetical protein EG68_03977 [Paragonimus skrjabini miyazakii]|uniref:Uncharacterized protein n=1 Tax=Paragonimus skrjabini miyazakii TaxID=59628 RepID=A0A8S9YWT4_9TREM|nr:hypothetical protein EG68_03977 [Paragonimus skrjabini miyazakii]
MCVFPDSADYKFEVALTLGGDLFNMTVKFVYMENFVCVRDAFFGSMVDQSVNRTILLNEVKTQAKKLMEEAVFRSYVHEESTSITLLCASVLEKEMRLSRTGYEMPVLTRVCEETQL